MTLLQPLYHLSSLDLAFLHSYWLWRRPQEALIQLPPKRVHLIPLMLANQSEKT